MYESPITLMVQEMARQVAKQQDEMVFSAVESVMPTVNREELIRALRYDRGQYDKGYADGKRDAMDELVRCKDCVHFVEPSPYDPCECMKWTLKWGRAFVQPDDFCSYGERNGGDGNG